MEMSTRDPLGGGLLRKAETLLRSVNLLSRRCGNPDFSQPYGPARPVTRPSLPFFTFTMETLLT
jgi:hypothetical protein